jgi:hypothetical protein
MTDTVKLLLRHYTNIPQPAVLAGPSAEGQQHFKLDAAPFIGVRPIPILSNRFGNIKVILRVAAYFNGRLTAQ